MFKLIATLSILPLLWHVGLASSCVEDRHFGKFGESTRCENGCCDDMCCPKDMGVMPMIGLIAGCIIVIAIVIGVVIVCVKKYNRPGRVITMQPEKPKIVVYHTDQQTEDNQKPPAYPPPAYMEIPDSSMEKKDGLPAGIY
ncbi:uncharacterized protein LOC121367899 [Gigantopelta aegis]|uniref:uncharacterized protein LOC121367899 n=1 Tax=Gigantopelta aegis TaxID=1735272 RepID=UPI001B888B63|nr:uncharacterized protein LOC121367899 [Gigantopelta aegis]